MGLKRENNNKTDPWIPGERERNGRKGDREKGRKKGKAPKGGKGEGERKKGERARAHLLTPDTVTATLNAAKLCYVSCKGEYGIERIVLHLIHASDVQCEVCSARCNVKRGLGRQIRELMFDEGLNYLKYF